MNQDNASKQEQATESSAQQDEATLETAASDQANGSTGEETQSQTIDAEAADAETADQEGIDWKAYADELEAKLSKAEATIEGQKDTVLRAKADGENARRRAEQEVDKARKFALEKFAGELLVVVDNLERAIQATDSENDAVKPLLEGVEMTQKSLMSTLEKFDITVVDPQGEAFNPEHHQAMSMQETDELPANTVMVVMQKGYLINQRLLRPAMVMVSKGGTNKVDTQA